MIKPPVKVPPEWSLNGYGCPQTAPYATVVTVPLDPKAMDSDFTWDCDARTEVALDINYNAMYEFGITRKGQPRKPTLGKFKKQYTGWSERPQIELPARGGSCYKPSTTGWIRGIKGTTGRWNIRRSQTDLARLPAGTYKLKVRTRFVWPQRPEVITNPVTRTATIQVDIRNDPCVTSSEARRIRMGMTLSQVKSITGGSGRVQVRGSVTVRSFEYCSLNKDAVYIGFVGGRVASIVY